MDVNLVWFRILTISESNSTYPLNKHLDIGKMELFPESNMNGKWSFNGFSRRAISEIVDNIKTNVSNVASQPAQQFATEHYTLLRFVCPNHVMDYLIYQKSETEWSK